MSKVTLFGYGSLSEGMVHFDKIRDFIINKWEARARGSVYRLPVGYPVLLNRGEHMIQGTLVEIEMSPLLMSLLNEFHGYDPLKPDQSLCYLDEIEVEVGPQLDKQMAKVYFLNPDRLPQQSTFIEDGDWQKALKEDPAIPMKLTDRQKLYIKKLGQSTGRDIVPIDIALYRELMNLEIIRDKGRRLALTKHGKEVFRYLE